MRTFRGYDILAVLVVIVAASSTPCAPSAHAQVAPTITYPPPNTAAPNYAAPPTTGAPVQFDPYSMPATSPPTLPPTLPPASLPPGSAPQNFNTPYPAQLPQQPLLPWMTSPTQPPVGAQPRRGFLGGFEAAILEPRVGVLRISSALAPILLPPNQDAAFRLITNSTDYDLTFSPRVWAGYMGRQGFGGRVTWWYFDADSAVSTAMVGPVQASLQTRVKYNVFDFEATQLGAFQNWQFEVSGGVRYAETDQNLSVTLEEGEESGNVDISESFSGLGPTVSMSFKRPLGNWEGLTFIGKSRYSLMFGNADLSTSVTGDIDVPPLDLIQVSDTTVTSWELQIGAAWTRILRTGAVLNLGGFLEGQVWNPDSHGLFGPTFRASISR